MSRLLSDEEIAELLDIATDREYKYGGGTVCTIDVYPLLQAQAKLIRAETLKEVRSRVWTMVADDSGDITLRKLGAELTDMINDTELKGEMPDET